LIYSAAKYLQDIINSLVINYHTVFLSVSRRYTNTSTRFTPRSAKKPRTGLRHIRYNALINSA